jgi:drug/metabolite transporter (DMT)-like permease
MFAAFITTFMFALSAVCATRSTQQLGATRANFFRLTLATLFLGLWAYTWGQGTRSSAFAWFLFSGFIGFGLGDLVLFHAYKHIGSRLTVLLVHSLTAPFAGILEWMWLGTILTIPQIISGIVILTGISLALYSDKQDQTRPKAIGIFYGVLAGIGQAVGAVISRKAFKIAADSGEMIDGVTAAYQRILGGLAVAAVWMLLTYWYRSKTTPKAPFSKSWMWILGNALTGPALGVAFYQTALKSTPAGVVLPIVAIAPLVVIPFSHFMEKEPLGRKALAGFILAVAGAIALARLSF